MKATRKINPSAAALLILAAGFLSLAGQETDSLIIVGHPGSAAVIRRDGHNYVDLEGLAELTQSTISFNGTQIVMALPRVNAKPLASVVRDPGLSRNFAAAATEAMIQIRKWRAAMSYAIARNYSLAGGWPADLRIEAQKALGMASIAVSTASDKIALPVLTIEFNNMSTLTDKYVGMSEANTYIEPASLNSDPLNLKIIACASSLASMAAANIFFDDGSCQ
jgi:hypothetical protein